MLILRFILINSINLSLSFLCVCMYVCVVGEHDGEFSWDSQRDSRAEELIAYLSRSSTRHVEMTQTTHPTRNLSHRLHNRRSRCWVYIRQRDAYFVAVWECILHTKAREWKREREREDKINNHWWRIIFPKNGKNVGMKHRITTYSIFERRIHGSTRMYYSTIHVILRYVYS